VLVKKCNLEEVCQAIGSAGDLAIDTETTGLRPYHGDRPFSLVVATATQEFYIPISCHELVLSSADLHKLWGFIATAGRRFFLQNAKFDMHHLAQIGLFLPDDCTIHDTAVVARILNNSLPSYSLAYLSNHYLGDQKDDQVMAYIEEHGLWEWEEVPDLQRRQKKLFYYKVPDEIIIPYALKDARLTYDLALLQLSMMFEWDNKLSDNRPKSRAVYETECEVTKVCFWMERHGVGIDRRFAEQCLDSEKQRFAEAAKGFADETATEYKASAKSIIPALEARGVDTNQLPRTDKGNVQFDSKTLARIDDPVAKFVLDCKDSKSGINFYAGFLWHVDPEDRIHTDLRQQGTVTWRFSSSSPNLQNLTRSEENSVDAPGPRNCLIPSPGHCFVMMDYKQQEYRLMLNYAKQMDLIEQVKAGLDVHQATADLTGLTRHQSKTLNFALLYGAGPAKVSAMLGISQEDARDLIRRYFDKLPGVKSLIELVKSIAKTRGYLITWDGRVLRFPDSTKVYAAPNHLIQGGCAGITRKAMLRTAQILKGCKSRLVLTIHDELVFDMHPGDLSLVPELQSAMVEVFPSDHPLGMGVDVSHSWRSLGEKAKGFPQA
jgi:DNA polymerase-1